MTTSQEVLAGERNGDGWTLKWTTWLLLADDERWWWQVDAHRTGIAPPRNDGRPPFFRTLGVVVDGPIEGAADTDGEWLFLDGGTLDFGSGMGVIWNGPCDSRDAALAAVDGFLRMGMP